MILGMRELMPLMLNITFIIESLLEMLEFKLSDHDTLKMLNTPVWEILWYRDSSEKHIIDMKNTYGSSEKEIHTDAFMEKN